MIQVHILELFATPEIFSSSLGRYLLFLGGPPVAPVFACVLGFFLAASKKSTKLLVIRGAKTICLGMLLNVVLNLHLIISVNKGIYNINIWPYIFGVDILHFAGISIIIIGLLRTLLLKNLAVLVGFTMAAAFFGKFFLNYSSESLVVKYISAFFYGSCSWSYFPLFPWMAYPLMGVLFFQITQKYDLKKMMSLRNNWFTTSLFMLFLVLTISYAVMISSDLEAYYHHGLIFSLWLFLFLAGYSFFLNEINSVLGNTVFFNYLKWLGKYVTGIYVVQWVLIGNFATDIYKTISSPLYLLSSFLTALIASSAVVYFVLLIKKRFATSAER